MEYGADVEDIINKISKGIKGNVKKQESKS